MTSASRASYTLRNDTAELGALRKFIETEVDRTPLAEADRYKVVLAVDEAVSNIIHHGHPRGAVGSITVELEVETGRLVIFVRDSGRSFDPSNAPDVEIEAHVREGRRRGLGIFLMRRIMDEVHYNFKEGVRNELVLIKNFGERIQD